MFTLVESSTSRYTHRNKIVSDTDTSFKVLKERPYVEVRSPSQQVYVRYDYPILEDSPLNHKHIIILLKTNFSPDVQLQPYLILSFFVL